jgi:hypothetical protein
LTPLSCVRKEEVNGAFSANQALLGAFWYRGKICMGFWGGSERDFEQKKKPKPFSEGSGLG